MIIVYLYTTSVYLSTIILAECLGFEPNTQNVLSAFQAVLEAPLAVHSKLDGDNGVDPLIACFKDKNRYPAGQSPVNWWRWWVTIPLRSPYEELLRTNALAVLAECLGFEPNTLRCYPLSRRHQNPV